MKSKWLFCLSIILLLGAFLFLAAPATSQPAQAQVVYQTPTAMPDGRILYKVKPGDTCIGIAVLNNVDLDELRRLNGLQGENCFLQTDQELLLGIVAATPASAAQASPTPTFPPGTAFSGNGKICVYLFDDVNGNAIAEDGEVAISGGAASVNDRTGKVSLTGLTNEDGTPLCFADVPAGDYTISMAAPDGYNATTALTYALKLKAGDSSTLDFGAQLSSAAQPLPVSEGGRSPLMGIVGGLLLLAGAGLFIYLRTLRR